MKAATLRSNRLKRTLAVLADCEEHTTRDIILNARVCAVNSIVCELRANGIAITCRRERGIWYYRLGVERKPAIRGVGA